VQPDTYAKIPFAILETGLMMIGDLIHIIGPDLGLPAFMTSALLDTIARWTGGPLSWTVDLLGSGITLVGFILSGLGPEVGLPDWLGGVLIDIACGFFTPFVCVVPGAPPFDPCA
jgi:hypothetical protein